MSQEQLTHAAPDTVTETAPDVDAERHEDIVLESADDIANFLLRNDAEDTESGAETPEVDGGQERDASDTVEDDNAVQAEDAPEQPDAVEAPDNWSDEDKAVFDALPPEARRVVLERESRHVEELNTQVLRADSASKAHQETIAFVKGHLGSLIDAAILATEGEFGGLNWTELQRTLPPEEFLHYDSLRKERLAALDKTVRGFQAFEARETALEREQRARVVAEETRRAVPKLKTIMGKDFSPASFSKDASEYLHTLGAPDDHIQGISHGYMLELIAKAMRFDAQAKARSSAVAKVAAAPTVQKLQGDGLSSKKAALRARLAREPDNNDILTEYFYMHQ